MNSLSRTGAIESGFMRLAMGATSCCRITRLFASIFGKNNNSNELPSVIFRNWKDQKREVRKDFEKAVQDTTNKRLEKEERAAQKKD